MLTKLKQLSEHATQASKDPLYSISVEMSGIDIRVLKSQYEALFKVFEQLNEFQVFTDTYLNQRAVQLNSFYQMDL